MNGIKAKNFLEKYMSAHTHEILKIVVDEVCVQLGIIGHQVRNPHSDVF